MTMEERIPDLSDSELANLRANAVRLEHGGTPRQQTDAAHLLPLLDAELERRKSTKTAAARARPAAPRKRAAKAPAKATAKAAT